jgi:hypothetical protein
MRFNFDSLFQQPYNMQEKVLEMYCMIVQQVEELNGVLTDLEDVKDIIPHKVELFEQRRDLKEEQLEDLKAILKMTGYDEKHLPY